MLNFDVNAKFNFKNLIKAKKKKKQTRTPELLKYRKMLKYIGLGFQDSWKYIKDSKKGMKDFKILKNSNQNSNIHEILYNISMFGIQLFSL